MWGRKSLISFLDEPCASSEQLSARMLTSSTNVMLASAPRPVFVLVGPAKPTLNSSRQDAMDQACPGLVQQCTIGYWGAYL
jgi:hypothetical protein